MSRDAGPAMAPSIIHELNMNTHISARELVSRVMGTHTRNRKAHGYLPYYKLFTTRVTHTEHAGWKVRGKEIDAIEKRVYR